MKYILDGYNVIHKISFLQAHSLRRQREGLISLLETASAQNRQFKDITVVFDGKDTICAPAVNSTIKVIFSKGCTADKKIKEIVEVCGFARDIAVVSNDREVRFYSASLGAKKVAVEDFLKKVLFSRGQKPAIQLDAQQTNKINQELEKIWLNK